MLFALSACGQSEGGYRVKSVLTLVEQEYSIAFRTGDYVGEFVPAAIKVLMADGTVDALAQRWFGSRIISFESDANAIEKLKEKGLWFVCADMDGKRMYDLPLTGPIGLVVGNEGSGISRLVKEKCDYVAAIPMTGKIDSLNASVAAGVLMYEIVRQRG